MSDEYITPHSPGEYPDATRYGNHDLPAMGVRYDGAPLQGIRITSDAVEFGYVDDSAVSVILRHNRLEVYKDGEYISSTTREWENGVLPITADGIDAELALVSASEKVVNDE